MGGSSRSYADYICPRCNSLGKKHIPLCRKRTSQGKPLSSYMLISVYRTTRSNEGYRPSFIGLRDDPGILPRYFPSRLPIGRP
jgi:hypothetical protein